VQTVPIYSGGHIEYPGVDYPRTGIYPA